MKRAVKRALFGWLIYQFMQFAVLEFTRRFQPDAFALISFSVFAFIGGCLLAFQIWLLFVLYEALNKFF